MTLEFMLKILVEYENRLLELEARPVAYPMGRSNAAKPTEAEALNQALWMCVQMRTNLLKEDSLVEFSRKFGLIQGIFWIYDPHTLVVADTKVIFGVET